MQNFKKIKNSFKMFEQSVMLYVQHLNMVIDKYEKKSDTKYRRGCTHKVNSHRSIIP